MERMKEMEKADIEESEAEKWRKMTIEQLTRITNTKDLECVYYFTRKMADLQ